MADQKTSEDVARLLHALKAERNARKDAERSAAQLRSAMLGRLEALESRPAPNMNAALAGIAAIRRDVEATLGVMRSELDDLAAQVAAFIREG